MKVAFVALALLGMLMAPMASAGSPSSPSPDYNPFKANTCAVKGLYTISNDVVTNSVKAAYLQPTVGLGACLLYSYVQSGSITTLKTATPLLLSGLFSGSFGGLGGANIKSLLPTDCDPFKAQIELDSLCTGTPTSGVINPFVAGRRLMSDDDSSKFPINPAVTQTRVNIKTKLSINGKPTYFPISICANVWREQYSGFGIPYALTLCDGTIIYAPGSPAPAPSPL